MTNDDIRNTFRYHSPSEKSVRVHEDIRERMTNFVLHVAQYLPESREKSLFMTACQQAQMWANSSIAIHGLPDKENE